MSTTPKKGKKHINMPLKAYADSGAEIELTDGTVMRDASDIASVFDNTQNINASQIGIELGVKGTIESSPDAGNDDFPHILREQVKTKLEGYKPEETGEESEFAHGEKVSWYTMVNRFASCTDKFLLWCGIFCSLVFGASMPAFCVVFGGMVDGIGVGQDDEFGMLKEQALWMVYIGIAVLFLAFAQVSFLAIFAENISFKTKLAYFRATLEKDATWFDEHDCTQMASKISKEVTAVQRGSGEKIGNALMQYSSFVFGVAFSFYFGWIYTLILCGILPVMAISGWVMSISFEDGQIEKMRAYAQSAGYAEQALQAIRVVHTYGQETLELFNYGQFLNDARVIGNKQMTRVGLGTGMMWLVFNVLYAYCFYFGGYLIWNNIEVSEGEPYTGGVIIAVIFCVVFGSLGLTGATPAMTAISEGRVAGRFAFDVIDHKPDILVNDPDKNLHVIKKKNLKGEIKFKNVSFAYPSRPDLKVLKNFTCTFEAGKTIALVGPSGSGKSTIIQLLERFYDPAEGSVEIDGVNMKKINLTSLRNEIGFVSQEPILFNTTIKENLLFAKPNATDKEIKEALKDANAWNFIQKKMQEKGVDTMVGTGGGQLSGGQKQRIAIARAFIKKPKILLLDEATSALDKVNEKAVQEAIEGYRKLNGNITIVVIAHRLSTIRDADKICVLKDGVLTEMGNHEYLMQKFPKGTYAGFVAKQANAEEGEDVGEDNDDDEKITKDQETAKPQKLGDAAASNASLNQSKSKQDGGRSTEEQEMLDEVNKIHQNKMEVIEAEAKVNAQTSGFSKLLKWNQPKVLIFVGALLNAFNGFIQPVSGIFMSKLLSLMSLPTEYLVDKNDPTIKGMVYFEQEIKYWSVLYAIVGVVCFITYFLAKKAFGTLGENVTLSVREVLYYSIMQKNIGWFDHPENGTSVLTSAMAQDTSIINGVSTESIPPQCEAAFSFFGGIIIGFVYCWQEALICIGLSPLLVVGNALGMMFQKGLTDDQNEMNNEANLLCGDSIVNYKTVQSFGNTELIIKKYEEYLRPSHEKAKSAHIKIGLAFGISQFSQYATFAAMFFAGGEVLKASKLENGSYSLNPEDVFCAIFAIIFGASQAGMAASYGPDMGKATAAADRVFKIIEHKSEINAIHIDKTFQKYYKKLKYENVKGKIEFRNVWFRYPTRLEDFVLRGLNITVNPSESVALVGESGCGKSTFVNLLMRFYDPDHGEILLDGTNIKDINLHDLRKVISLVMQEPIIFNYSVLENILYGKTDAKNSEVAHAATISNCTEFLNKQARLDDDSAQALIKQYEDNKEDIVAIIGQEKFDEEIEVLKKCEEQEKNQGKFQVIAGTIDKRDTKMHDVKLHDGYTKTQCGIKGSKLSGGQKQRVAIARTIIRNPNILLLDEATSALDEDSQKKVQQALNNAMRGKTTIIIAHRMSTIENCDKIFVLEHGKVKEEGGFEDLKNKSDGYFNQMRKKARK